MSYFALGTAGGGQSFTAAASHSTTFIFTPGTLNGDTIAGLHTLNLGGSVHDVIDFEGFGAGAHLVQVNAAQWQLVSTNNPTETFTLIGGAVLGDDDYAFVAGGTNISGETVETDSAGSGSITVTEASAITSSSVGIVAKPATTGGEALSAAPTNPSVALFGQFVAGAGARFDGGLGQLINPAPLTGIPAIAPPSQT